MLIICQNCGHRYEVPVSVVATTKVRFPCRQCGAMVEAPPHGAVTAAEQVYFALIDGRHDGPYDLRALAQLRGLGRLTNRTLVWGPELDAWKQLGQTQLLSDELSGRQRWWLTIENVGEVASALGEFLRMHPSDPATLKSLKELLNAGRDGRQVADILEPALRVAEDWVGLAEVYERRLVRLLDLNSRQSCRLELARLHADYLSDHDTAFGFLADALGEDPGDENVLGQLAALPKDAGLESDYLSLLLSVHHDQEQGEEASDVTLELAEALWRAGELVQLIAVLEPYAHESRVARLWQRALREGGQWVPLSESLERTSETATGVEWITLKLELADIYATRLRSHSAAYECWRAVLERMPTNLEAAEGLQYLFEDEAYSGKAFETLRHAANLRGDWSAVRGLYERQIVTLPANHSVVGDMSLALAALLIERFADEADEVVLVDLLDSAARLCLPEARVAEDLVSTFRAATACGADEALRWLIAQNYAWIPLVLSELSAQDNDSHAAWDAYFTMLATPHWGVAVDALGSRTFQVESWRALVDELGQALSMTAAFFGARWAIEHLEQPGRAVELLAPLVEADSAHTEGAELFVRHALVSECHI